MADDFGGSSTKIEKLNDSNFYAWKQKIILILALKDLDEFNALDESNKKITQEWLDSMLDYLNGKKSFEGISARNTVRSIHKRQKEITKAGVDPNRTKVARDKSIALASFNKTLMLQIKLVNRLRQARITVVWVHFGTGGASGTLRQEAALFNDIPKELQPNKLC